MASGYYVGACVRTGNPPVTDVLRGSGAGRGRAIARRRAEAARHDAVRPDAVGDGATRRRTGDVALGAATAVDVAARRAAALDVALLVLRALHVERSRAALDVALVAARVALEVAATGVRTHAVISRTLRGGVAGGGGERETDEQEEAGENLHVPLIRPPALRADIRPTSGLALAELAEAPGVVRGVDAAVGIRRRAVGVDDADGALELAARAARGDVAVTAEVGARAVGRTIADRAEAGTLVAGRDAARRVGIVDTALLLRGANPSGPARDLAGCTTSPAATPDARLIGWATALRVAQEQGVPIVPLAGADHAEQHQREPHARTLTR
jgi:hypothetical protein